MRLKKFVSAAILTGLAALSASFVTACVENRSTLFIDHVIGFSPDSDSCKTEASIGGDGLYLGTGNYDPTTLEPYVAYLVVANQLTPLGDSDTLRPETSRIQIEGAEINVTSPGGGTDIPPFTTNFAATIHPDSSNDPGLISVSLPLIPGGQDISPGRYLVGITIFGKTLGGTNVESGEFVFPIDVLRPRTLLACATREELIEAEAAHPCINGGQDSFYYPCTGRESQIPGCAEKCPTL